MPTPLELAREDNRNFLLYSDEDLINELYSQYQDRYPDKRLFTEFLTTDTNAFDTSRLTGTTVQPSPETIEEEPEEKPFGLTTLPEFGADLITEAIPKGFTQAVGSGFKYASGLQKMPDYFSGDLQEVTAQYRAALSILNEKDQYSTEIVNRAEQIVDIYRNKYSAKESKLFKTGEYLQEFAEATFPQDQRWKDNKLADTIYKGFEGIGSTVPIIAASVVTAPIGGPVPLVAGLSTAIAMEGGESIDRVYDFDGDTDENDVVMATILGVAPGSADYLPVQILLNRFNKIIPGSKSRVANILKQSTTQGIWEGGTEEFQNVLQNLIEQTYNKEREVFDYAGEQFGPGFVAGVVFGGISGGVQRKEKLEDKVDEKTILEDDGSETIEGNTEEVTKEATEVGTPDEVAPDSSPDGYPPVGSNNIVLTKSGETIGKGRVVEYPVVLNDDGSTSKNIRVELDEGGIVEEPLDRDLKIDWLDKPETKPVEEEIAPVEEEIVEEEITPIEEEITPIEENIIIPPDIKVGDTIEVFDIAGNKYKTKVTAKDETSGSIKVKNQQGQEVVVNQNASATTVNIRSPNYEFDTVKIPKPINELSKKELELIKEKLEGQRKIFEDANATNQLDYITIIKDLNAVKLRLKEGQAKETKPSLQVDSITGDNGWNRQMGQAIASDNETLKDELTQLPLDNLLSQENNLSALKVTSRYIEQGKLENETVQKNFDAINKRIAELEGRPVEQPTPVVEETTPEVVAPVVETTEPITALDIEKFPDNYDNQINSLIDQGFDGTTNTVGSKSPFVRELYDLNQDKSTIYNAVKQVNADIRDFINLRKDEQTETVTPVVEEKPLTTVEKIFAKPTTPVEPVKKEEEKDVLTEEEMAGFLSTLEETDAVTKETPVVEEVPSDPKERAKFYNDNVAEVQRGKPERAMLRANMYHAGALSPLLESAGDLIHRATELGGIHGAVKEKVEKLLRNIRLTPGDPAYLFPRTIVEHERQIKSNVKSKKIDEKEYRDTLNKLLADYVAEHEKMPTYNELQENSKQAAIAVGKLDFEEAIKFLKKIKAVTDKGKKFFDKKALEYYGDKKTPVVKDEITQREEAVQQREDDLTFGQGIFRLYDPRSPLRTAKEYNNALNAYRREIADPSVIGRKYLQDVEKAYAKRVNQLTNTEFLDNLYIDEQADPLNYTQFERLLNELGNATLDIKDQATGKLIRKKTAEIKVKPVRDAIKYIKDKNYDKKPPETPPLPEFAEQKEEVSERDTETITDITDVERGESVLGSREQPDTDVSGASERVTTGVRGVPTSVSKPTPDISGERGRPRREDESVDPTEGQDVQSRNEVEGRLVGDNITGNVSGQLGDTVTGIESSSVPDTTETQQELRDNAQRKHDNVVAERSLASDIGKIEGLNNNDKQIIKDVFTYDYDIFEEVYLDYDATTLQGFKKTKIPSYLQNDIEETLIDTMEDQQELLQQIYNTTKNKYPELSPNINRYNQEKLEEDFDDFASSLNDLKSRITPPGDGGAAANLDSGVGQVEYGSEVFGVPTIKPTKESYDKVKPQLLKRLDQHSKAGLPFQSAMKSLINDIDRSFIDTSLTPEQKNEARSNSEQWKTSMGAFVRFATDIQSEYKNVQGERNTLFQTKYNPKVKGNSLDTHMPIELLASSGKGLRNLDVRVGDIKQYVADNLDMSLDEVNDKFGSEQIEALGLAIDQLKANKGFVLGDQTGIGKGRVVAALMRYAKKNAQHVVFVTHKSGLYTDMIRDMKDIGEDVSNMKILPTDNNHTVDLSSLNEESFKTETREKHEALLNKLSSDQGMLENNYDYIFTTYYQLNRDSKPDEQGFKTPINKARHNFIESIAPNAIFILDESHNAGGSSNRKVKADKINTRATFIRHALNNSRGAVFSSATWAKNPVVMDLYMNTDIQESIPDSDQFVDVMQTRGIPLQQIVTNMLAQTGQYRRVERSFDGVEYSVYNDGKGVAHDKELAKQISDLFLDIHLIDMQLSDIAKKIASSDPDFASAQAQAGLQGRVVPSDFKSQMYNISTMLMTSFKVNDAVNYANNEVKNNQRKVVITVSRTGENLLRQIMADKSLKAGDRITLTYNDLLLKYLDRALEYTMSVKVPKADVPIYSARKKLSNEEVNEFGEGNLVEQIEELKSRIRDTDFGNLSLNPVDNIINNLRNSNIKVGEITGRQYAIDSKGIITPRGDSSIKKRRRIDSFQNGELDVLVINQSASTGYSMHSDQRAKDKKQRHMIVLEAEPEINTYLQMLGRIFRTGQVSLPKYTIMTTDHPAEQRLSSMLAKKMASLNATVTGGQDSVYTTSDSLDFFNTIGDKVTKEFLESHAEIRDVLDIDLTGKIDGIANKVSSSLLIFDPALATEYYDFVAKRYVELKEEETAFGTNTLDMANLTKADAISIGEIDMIQDGSTTGTIFQQPVYMEQVSINKKTKPLTQTQLQKELRTTLGLTTENVQLDKKNAQEKVNKYNEKQLDQAVEIYDTAIEKVRQDTTKKPAQIQSQVKKLQDVKNQITRNIKSFPVGTQIRISLNTGKDNAIVEHGIILDRKHEGTSTATNTGSFKIKIALAQGDAQKITLGLSRFIDNQGNLSSENRIENALTTPEGKSIDELFVSGQENVRETRYIVTGNLLTGSAIVKGGQVAKLQRNDGTIIQTIVMPKNYKHEKAEASIPVLLDYQAATSYLYNSKFGELKTYSGDVRIQKTGGDSATVFTTRKDIIERALDKSDISMVDLDFKKSSDGRTWSATTTLSTLKDYVLPNYAGNGINFQTIKEREIAKEAKEKVILQNEQGIRPPSSAGAMGVDPETVKESIKEDERKSKDNIIKRSRNTLTSLFNIVKNKKRINPFIDKDRSSTDSIHIPKETLSKIEKEGILPTFIMPFKYFLPTYVTANQLKDKSIAKLIQKGIEYESKIRVRSKTFIDRYKKIRTKYKGAQFSKVVDLLFVGDASQKVFTDKELKEGFTLTKQEIADLKSQGFSINEINKIKSIKFSNKEIAMYKEIRLLFDKIGKYIDQHRRSMLPKIRSAQALIRTRLYSLISPDSLSDFKKLMVQRSNKMRQIRNGIGNPQTQLAELLEIDERIYSIPLINTSPTTFNSFITAYENYYIEENKLQSTSVRRKVGYVPHKFFGNFKLKVLKEIDENGNEIYENLITPQLSQETIDGLRAQGRTNEEIESIASAVESSKNTLFFNSKEDAIKAAQEHIKNNPTDTIRVEPTDLQIYSNDATVLNDQEYRSIMNSLTESLSEKYTAEELRGNIKDVIRRKGRRRIPEFSLKRRGVAGYDKNLDKVFRTFAGSVSKYVYMDELKYDYVNLMERKGWGEVSEVSDEARPVANWLRSWWDDVNNRPQETEIQIDKALNTLEKSVPKKIFYAAGIGAIATPFVVGGPIAPLIIGGATSIMMARSMGKTQRKSRAITGDMLSLSAHLKLGSFFNLSSALVNLSQIGLNTYSKMGAVLTSAGFRRAIPALYRLSRNDYREIIKNRKNYSASKVNSAMDALLLAQKAEIKSSYFYSDRAPDIFTEQSKLGQLSMLWFQSAESLNRATSFFAGYIKAEKQGKNREQAIKSGLFAVQQQQFSYDNAAKPGVLRNTFLRVPLQFKNWFIQELVFISGLRNAEIPRFLASTFVLAGALGHPAYMLLSQLISLLTGGDYEPDKDLMEWAINESAKGNLNGMVGQFITHGAPAIISEGGTGIGINLTNRVGFGDRFLPSEIRDLYGPFINTLLTSSKLKQEGATAVDHLVNLSPAFKPLKSIEAMAGGMPLSTIATDTELFTNNMAETLQGDQKPVYTNPYKNQSIKYELTLSDVFRMTFGFEPTKVAQFNDLTKNIRSNKEKRLENLEDVRTDINIAVRKYGNDYESLNVALTFIIEEAIKNGIEINRTGIKRMIKDAFFSQIDKDLKSAPKTQRLEIIDQIKALEKYYGLDFSQLVD